METFAFADLKEIMDYQGKPCVSVYLPMHRTGTEIKQNSVRFRNVLHALEKELSDKGHNSQTLLKKAYELAEDNDFWQNQNHGLALFISSDFFKYFRVPLEFSSTHHINERFLIKPIIPLLTTDGKFFVLTLNQKSVHFFECNRYDCNELQIESLPKDIEDALGHEVPNTTLQLHSGGGSGGAPMYHGQGGIKDQMQDRVMRFLNEVDRGLEGVLREEKAPLVVAGVSYYLPYFREVSSYKNIYEKSIEGNPEDLKPNELHKKAWELIKPYFEKAEKEALDEINSTGGTPLTATDIESIMSGAFTGRVDYLLIDKEHTLWGKFDEVDMSTVIHEEKEDGDEDLLDLIAFYTLHHHGTVYVLSHEKMPFKSKAVARFRY